MKRLIVLIALGLAAPLALATPLKGAVYSPSKGVVCDRKANFCADSSGISMGFTREYLGAKAEKIMLDRITKVEKAGSHYDLTWFAFSNGVDCMVAQQRCTTHKHSDKVDAAHTKALFGK